MNSHICTFHKCGSNWFRYIFISLSGALEYNYKPIATQPGKLNEIIDHRSDNSFIIYPVGKRSDVFDRLVEGERILMCIRDPRDALISQYWSWRESHHNNSAQLLQTRDLLRGMTEYAGLLHLVKEKKFAFGEQVLKWNKSDIESPFTRTLKYEDLKASFHDELRQSLNFLGVNTNGIDFEAIRVENDFSSRVKRKPGEEDRSAHLRKGIVGDYANYFDDDLKEAFYERYGLVMDLLGYG